MKALGKMTTDELKGLAAKYTRAIEQEEVIFAEHKKAIIRVFQETYQNYCNRLKIKTNLLTDTELQFLTILATAETVQQLDEIVTAQIGFVARLESSSSVATERKITPLLRNTHDELCRKAWLPRKFDEHVRPATIKIIDEEFYLYLSKTGGRAEEAYTELFSQLREKVKNCINEDTLSKELDLSISGIQAVKATLSRGFFNLPIFNSTDKVLEKSLTNVKERLASNGFLKAPKVPSENLAIYRERTAEILIQLELKEKAYAEKREEIKNKHKKVFNYIADRVGFFKTREFYARYYQKFTNIANKKREETEISVLDLKNELAALWSELAIDSEREFYNASKAESPWWFRLKMDIKKGRLKLIAGDCLSKSYGEDERFSLVELYDSEILNAYEGTWGSVGDKRQEQIKNLRTSLRNTGSKEEARAVIEKALFEVRRDHETHSLGYNMFRKSSRAVSALETILEKGLDQGLLAPKTIPAKKPVSEIIEERLEKDYFSRDTVKNSRSSQKAKYDLLEKIRSLEEKERNGEERPLKVKQVITRHIDDTIRLKRMQHQDANGLTQWWRHVHSHEDSRFAKYLENIRRDLLAGGEDARLLLSYEDHVWPKIRDTLQMELDNFKLEPLPQRPASPSMFDTLFAGDAEETEVSMYEDEKEEALFEANQLLSQLSIVEDTELAMYMLSRGIAALQQRFAPLAAALMRGEQALLIAKVIPAIANTTFFGEYLSKLGQERDNIRKIAENTIKAAKISGTKLERIGQYPQRPVRVVASTAH